MISLKTKERLIEKHLSKEGYCSMIFEGDAWICEKETKLVHRNGYAQIVTETRLICPFEDGDNIFGIRHIRMKRNWYKMHEEWKRRIAEPKASRQAELDEASEEFKEKFSTWSSLQGLFGTLTL